MFNLKGFFTWHLVMTILMVCVWLILFVLTVWAFIKGKIFLAKPEEVIQDTVGAKEPEEAHSNRSSVTEYNKEAHNHV